MKHTLPPNAFFKRNRDAFIAQMKPHSAAIFRSSPRIHKNADEHHKYEPDSDFFYLTGIEAPLAALMLYPGAQHSPQMLFIEKPDPTIEEWTGRRMTEDEAREQSGCDQVLFIENFEQALAGVLAAVANVYLNYRPVPLNAPLNDGLQFAKAIRERFPHADIIRANSLIAKQRLVKAPEEIELLREAVRITGLGVAAAWMTARPGIHEFELQSAIEKTYLDNRSGGVGFQTIVASGINACTLHYENNECVIPDGDLVLVDTGADYGHYTADISRTFPVNGTFSPRQKEVYQKVLDAHKKTIALIKPGITLAGLNNQTREMLITACKDIGLKQKTYEEYYTYVKHGVSHHLGLDAHDVIEIRDQPLAPGQVITIEPGLYIAEENIGIRIEDDVLVTKNGCEVLSKDIPREVSEIETLMRR